MVTMDVSARELKLHLGLYLDAIGRGEVVRVTRHGTVVAELRPPALTAREKLARLVAEGMVRPGSGRPLRPYEPVPAPRSGTEIILEDRASEDA
jgi:antitoxin (DNA-binding transcriptional repressor) of toxin-antitoxin stability system